MNDDQIEHIGQVAILITIIICATALLIHFSA